MPMAARASDSTANKRSNSITNRSVPIDPESVCDSGSMPKMASAGSMPLIAPRTAPARLEHAIRRRFVDDHYRRRRGAIAIIEQPPPDQLHTERAEVRRRDMPHG